jgi:purine-binding chemotaxis protein CheW
MAVEKNKNNSERQLVVFCLAGETYGIDISSVHEIIRMQTITEVPRTPDFVEGVINLRGRIVPVMDLRKRFGLHLGEKTANSRVIVVEVNGVTVGMIVDAVSEVLRLPEASIEPPPPMFTGVDVAYLQGVGKWQERLIILLNLDKVLYAQEQHTLKNSFKAGGLA